MKKTMSKEKVILKEPTYSKTEYNNEPIHYCRHCLSLRILNLGEYAYCDKCGSTEIEETSIDNWEKLYMDKYGHKFIENGREEY